MVENSLDSLEYNPLVDIKEILLNQENKHDFSLEEVINTTKLYKTYLHKKLQEAKQAETEKVNENVIKISNEDLKTQFKDLSISIDKFHSENKSLMRNMRDIQTSKNNLTTTIKYYNALETVRKEYDYITKFLKIENYIEILPVFKEYSENLEHLINEYGNVVDFKEINKFKEVYDNLELKSKRYIKQLFQAQQYPTNQETNSEEVESDSNIIDISKTQFQSLLKIINLFQDKTILKSIDNWIIDSNLLFEFKQIFNVNDEVEVTSLENLDRRFIFFKKILSNFMIKYEDHENSWFPSESKLSLKLTETFCKLTAEDLEIILKREFESNNSAITEESGSASNNSDLFMASLEKCLEFEKYVKLKFKNQLVTDAISSRFKPYISIWINKQEDVIRKKISQYLADPKLSSDGSKDMIIPSSMDLFRTYKNILNESLQLIKSSNNESSSNPNEYNNDRVFKKLAKIYHNGINSYQKQIIDPLIIKNYKETIVNTKIQEIIDYTVLVVNTCDYLVTTLEDLSLKLQDYCQEEKYKNRIDDLLSSNKQALMKVINYNISTVLMNEIIGKELEFVFKEFQHVNWNNAASNVNTSRYVSSLNKILTNEKSCSLIKITSLFYKEIYIYNLFDKLVNYIIRNFLDSMVKILTTKTTTTTTSSNNNKNSAIIKLWSIDFPEIIDSLQKYPANHITNISATANGMKRCSETTLKELNNRLGNFVNLLNTDLGEYTDKFIELTFNCDNSIIWLYLLKLKGLQNSNEIIDLWKNQAVGKGLKSNSNQWFIFTMTKFLQDGFIEYNNKLYVESIGPNNTTDPWKKFLKEIIQVVEFKKTIPQQQRVVSPSTNNTQQQQQGIQQKIGMLWNSM